MMPKRGAHTGQFKKKLFYRQNWAKKKHLGEGDDIKIRKVLKTGGGMGKQERSKQTGGRHKAYEN